MLNCIHHFYFFDFYRTDWLSQYETLPDRIFRAKIHVTDGDDWSNELADQNSLRFQHRARFYEDSVDLMINLSDLKTGYKKSEVLAFDG